MTREQADALAQTVRTATPHEVAVEGDGPYFTVTVRSTDQGSWTLYDEQDWDWLRERIEP